LIVRKKKWNMFTFVGIILTYYSNTWTRPAWAGFKTGEEGRAKIL
jgi:hypothetical protein